MRFLARNKKDEQLTPVPSTAESPERTRRSLYSLNPGTQRCSRTGVDSRARGPQAGRGAVDIDAQRRGPGPGSASSPMGRRKIPGGFLAGPRSGPRSGPRARAHCAGHDDHQVLCIA